MIKNICFLLLIALITCKKKDQKYNLPIPRNELKSLLVDLYIAGAATEVNPAKNKDSLKQIYHTEICKIHKMTSKQIAEITEQLHSMPKINSEIQREVLDSMNKMQSPNFKNQ